MKYLKLYENIDFDDISEEEYQFDDNILNNIHIKPGDKIINQNILIWFSNKWFNHSYYRQQDSIIDNIELSDNIYANPYGDDNKNFKKIPDNQIMFSIKGFPYWLNYNKNIKIK